MRPQQIVELSPVDADRLGVRDGDQVEVGGSRTATRVRGAARLRASVPGGSVFLVEGTHEQPANVLTEPLVAGAPRRRRRRAGRGHRGGRDARRRGPRRGSASAPLNIPPTSAASA